LEQEKELTYNLGIFKENVYPLLSCSFTYNISLNTNVHICIIIRNPISYRRDLVSLKSCSKHIFIKPVTYLNSHKT